MKQFPGIEKCYKLSIVMSDRGTLFCRCCGKELGESILGLGSQPLSNALPVTTSQTISETFPLDFKICLTCGLGQIGEYVAPAEIFGDYTYFSSASSTWLDHAKEFTRRAFPKVGLSKDDLVIEIASNDGYLLQYFKEFGCKVLGIEPAANVAKFAERKGIPTRVEFFGEVAAKKVIAEGKIPRLVVANNVLAHVPDIDDFMAGLSYLASVGAIVSVEAPSMLSMLQNNYFDTIYHEHFSYLSVHSIDYLAEKHDLELFDVESIKTHGGSYRYWLRSTLGRVDDVVKRVKQHELDSGILNPEVHEKFAADSNLAISNFEDWVNSQRAPILGFGAAAKATVLLNAAKISNEKIVAVADSSPSKQGRLIPGVNIKIVSPNELFSSANQNLIIFPWNIADEIHQQIKETNPRYSGEIWVPLPSMRKIN